MVNRWSQNEKISLSIKMELSSIEAIRKMVMLEAGLSILSKRAVHEDLENGDLIARPVPNIKNDRYISLIYRRDRPITPVLQRFITELYRCL